MHAMNSDENVAVINTAVTNAGTKLNCSGAKHVGSESWPLFAVAISRLCFSYVAYMRKYANNKDRADVCADKCFVVCHDSSPKVDRNTVVLLNCDFRL